MFKKIDQKQRNFTLIFELVTHSTYEMKVVVMIQVSPWKLVFGCRGMLNMMLEENRHSHALPHATHTPISIYFQLIFYVY
jgi:hypothetical protein